MSGELRVGLGLPQFGSGPGPASGLAHVAATAERLGYHSLWVADRLITPPAPTDPYPGPVQPYPPEFTRAADPLLTLTVAAGATRRVRLGSSTLNGPHYHPLPLARALTTLDVLSDGRLDVGLGLGWMREEYQAVGIPWTQRGARLDDLLDLLRVWWHCDTVSHHSAFVDVDDLRVDLRPAQPGGPPIHLAGFTEPALTRVGQRAAAWLTFENLPADVERRCWEAIRRAADAAGRDPDGIARIARLNPEPGTTPADIATRVARQGERGASEVIVDLAFVADPQMSSSIVHDLADRLSLSPDDSG